MHKKAINLMFVPWKQLYSIYIAFDTYFKR